MMAQPRNETILSLGLAVGPVCSQSTNYPYPLPQVGFRHINDYVSYVWVRDNEVSFSNGLNQVPAPLPNIGFPQLQQFSLPESSSVFWNT